MAAIADHLAAQAPVLVLSGTPGSASHEATVQDRPVVVEIKNRIPAKAALIRRAAAEALFTMRVFVALLLKLRRGDVALTVPAPFMLPYAVAAAARLKRARSALIMHDLYPDVLVMAGLLRAVVDSRQGDAWRQRADVSRVECRHYHRARHRSAAVALQGRHARQDPVYSELGHAGAGRAADSSDNPYRRLHAARFLVGLSGNLGFTHDPDVVFDAARLLRDDPDIHFLLSGWGIGFERLKQLQSDANLPNVTLVERVPEEDLEQFLSAADIWLIPYRKDLAGVSVPSRFYNLLAIGRPVCWFPKPNAEAALTVSEHDLGWVVEPGNPDATGAHDTSCIPVRGSVTGPNAPPRSRSATILRTRWRAILN